MKIRLVMGAWWLGGSLFAIAISAAPAPEVPPPPLAHRADAEMRAKLVKEYGGTEASEAAVERGLAWLAAQQERGGSWKSDGQADNPDASTGMVLLAFLGAGESPQSKRYGKQVRAGLDYLIGQLRKDGRLARLGSMYDQGIATLALCEAYGLTGNDDLREPAQRAVDFVVSAQHAGGSWGYGPSMPGDTSITGWQLQALVAARTARLKVPADTFDKADGFLDTVLHDDGGYGYMKGAAPTPNLTAVGAWCRSRLDWANHEASLRKSTDLLKAKAVPGGKDASLYGWYRAMPFLLAVGGDDWKTSNPRFRDFLIEHQEKSDNATKGSWGVNGPVVFSPHCGRLMNTAVVVQTLEVYYRDPPSIPESRRK